MSDTIPTEARERMMGVLVWGWLNAHRPDVSIEHVAEQALRSLLAYLDEHCPEWYGRRWLEREEMEQVRKALGATLDQELAVSAPARDEAGGGVPWVESISAYDKIARALGPA